MYEQLMLEEEQVNWCHLIQHNGARPRAIVCLWLVCHNRLATKARLKRLGLLHEDCCNLCEDHKEDIDHLLTKCKVTRNIWQDVLSWLEVKRNPQHWQEEMKWILQNTKGKSFRASMLKIAVAETVHGIWRFRNEYTFGLNTNKDSSTVVHRIIESIVFRGWLKDKFRKKLALLMM
ncbi:uncharacterized protein LOC131619300 [Vicia villosa]|uniref:uncharacterized protein LOC131619300 n=1 Tax=Vicia villosa TaxID=3911 RepID=UPI00273C7ED8|nr:uncharacterized protein LOC131619300 [Vicia villosa]